MNKKIPLVVGVLALGLAAYAFVGRNGEEKAEIEFRYQPVAKGELIRSISATGQVVALSSVDIKSKAGGKVVDLLVDEGSSVVRGQPIAIIDPEDTRAIFQQADADLQSASARAAQAEENYRLQREQSETAVAEAEAALEAARVRARRARLQRDVQPQLTSASVRTARANLTAAQADLEKLVDVTIPQMERDAEGQYRQAQVALTTAEADLKRQEGLLEKGYVAGSNVDRARSAAASARTAYETARQRRSTLESETRTLRRTQEQMVQRAQAAYDEARANQANNQISDTGYEEALRAVRQAEVALQRARDARRQNEIRRNEMLAAQASIVRSRVAANNAKVQLDSTTVIAPSPGVITRKYLEEGTIIPPGTSTFAQGTSIFQLSDVTQLFVECAVDEADIANVKEGQPVRIVLEAFPREKLNGIVTRVHPAAQTEQNITAVKVRVKVLPGSRVKVLPGMNATCEFITMDKPNVLIVPAQAVKQDGGKATVRVKNPDPTKPPIVREIKVGETGNEGIEVLDGLKEGDEVVTAEIDMRELRAIQQKMKEAQEGGGLAGGRPMGPRGGGGQRVGGGGGGGGR